MPLLGPDCVGERVVVRRRVAGETGPSGGPALTDTIGVMESWADGVTVIRTKHGLVEIDTSTIESGKPIPPAPGR